MFVVLMYFTEDNQSQWNTDIHITPDDFFYEDLSNIENQLIIFIVEYVTESIHLTFSYVIDSVFQSKIV